jgi:glycine/D-amino acid oxidase-like deaminating enzyme
MQAQLQHQGVVQESARALPVAHTADVIVAGGGTAGVIAAIAAARNGAKTLLVERNGFLGGAITAAMMAQISASAPAVTGIGRELVNRLNNMGGVEGAFLIPIDPEAFKLVALEMLEDAGAKLLLYTSITGIVMEETAARGIIVENKSGRQALLAKIVIDCTGDGDVCNWAGVPIELGREHDHKTRPMSIIFKMANVDIDGVVRYAREHPDDFSPDPNYQVLQPEKGLVRTVGYFSLVEKAKANGELFADCHYVRLEGVNVERGTVLVNASRIYNVDGTKAEDLTRADLQGRRQAFQVAAFLRKYVQGFERAYLAETASNVGVRESRHVLGEHVLCEDDVVNDRQFPDAIVRSFKRQQPGTPSHSPDAGEGSASDVSARSVIAPIIGFSIPYRCLVPKKIDDLLVAGRCISQTHIADGWTRLQSCVWSMGQAAGTAAALAVRDCVTPRQMIARVADLQALLKAQGVGLADSDFKYKNA